LTSLSTPDDRVPIGEKKILDSVWKAQGYKSLLTKNFPKKNRKENKGFINVVRIYKINTIGNTHTYIS
jgi:hypothetical protein